ncbi:hypothetical protein SUGI_0114860 [Cryptomeria japonica]|nr:hypothetical protein SUGI_0114860 [Cryptomeria japonica]
MNRGLTYNKVSLIVRAVLVHCWTAEHATFYGGRDVFGTMAYCSSVNLKRFLAKARRKCFRCRSETSFAESSSQFWSP